MNEPIQLKSKKTKTLKDPKELKTKIPKEPKTKEVKTKVPKELKTKEVKTKVPKTKTMKKRDLTKMTKKEITILETRRKCIQNYRENQNL